MLIIKKERLSRESSQSETDFSDYSNTFHTNTLPAQTFVKAAIY